MTDDKLEIYKEGFMDAIDSINKLIESGDITSLERLKDVLEILPLKISISKYGPEYDFGVTNIDNHNDTVKRIESWIKTFPDKFISNTNMVYTPQMKAKDPLLEGCYNENVWIFVDKKTSKPLLRICYNEDRDDIEFSVSDETYQKALVLDYFRFGPDKLDKAYDYITKSLNL